VGKEAQAQSIAAAVGCAVAAMPEGWPNNSDIHDLAETEGLDMVAALLASASEPPKPEPRYKLLTAADIEAMPPLDWRIKGVLPTRGLAQIYGASKAGKSFLAFDMACAIAEGLEWFGYRVNAAPVVYVCLEGEAGFKLRAEAWKRHNGRSLPSDLHLVMQPFRINLAEDVQDLATVVPAGAVTVIDTQNRAAPDADENASKDMGAIIEGAKALQGASDGMVILVAHTGKTAGMGPRGHSSQIPAVDAAIEVNRNTDDSRTWRADKVKDGQDGAEHGFRLEVIELGIDDDGDPLTSCAIATAELTKRQKLMTESQRQGVAAYCLACEAGDGLLGQTGEFEGLPLEAWRAKFYELSTADNLEAKKKAFQRTRADLKKDGLATVLNDIYSLNDFSTNIRTPQFKAAAISKAAAGTNGTAGQRDISGTLAGHVLTKYRDRRDMCL
jgi:AAA domain